MSIARQLYQLQEIEQEIESKEQALAQCLNQLGDSKAVTEAKANLSNGRQHLEELKSQQHSAEWEIEDLGARLAKAKDALYSGRIKNPKELASLQQEVEGLEAQLNQLEERTLETMEQVELAATSLNALNSEIEALEAEWRSQQQRLSTEIEQLKELLSELEKERQLVLDGIDSRTIDYYNQLKKQKGWAVAKIEQGTCRGCRITLSTAELQRARGDQLVECNSCRRILFLD
jgi:predicted  nucleic acid-binding Zn-ribbon protein